MHNADLAYDLGTVIRQAKQFYFVPKECIIKVSNDTGYEPDIVVWDEKAIADEPRWERESIITARQSIKLAVEVVSTNWRDDCLFKLADYKALVFKSIRSSITWVLGDDAILALPSSRRLRSVLW